MIIVPTLTFIAPVNSIVYNGADPIFMDSDSFYNLDTYKTIQFIKDETVFKDGYSYNKKTNKKRISSIIIVHVWGNATYIDDLVPLCKERNIVLVEDASESLVPFTNQDITLVNILARLGIGCLSFNGNKIITSGGGGMIVLITLN